MLLDSSAHGDYIKTIEKYLLTSISVYRKKKGQGKDAESQLSLSHQTTVPKFVQKFDTA